MRTKLTCIAALSAATAAVAIATSPTAVAVPIPKICLAAESGAACHFSGGPATGKFVPRVRIRPGGIAH